MQEQVARSSVRHAARYPLVARLWGVGFAGTLLTFIFRPEGVGHDLASLAALFHLDGDIPTAGGSLWWVLALATMTSVTVLAFWSAHEPTNDGVFVALMTSKLTSTSTCLVLAAMNGPAWLLCAATDGFIALTLWLARRHDLRAGTP